MNKKIICLSILLGGGASISFSPTSYADGSVCEGQKYSDLISQYSDETQSYIYTQTPEDSCLILTPNNVFFEDQKGLKSTDDLGDGTTLPDADMNQNKDYSSLIGWKDEEATLDWPVRVREDGTFTASVIFETSEDNLDAQLSGATITLVAKRVGTDVEEQLGSYQINGTGLVSNQVDFHLNEGVYTLSLKASNIVGDEVGVFKSITLKETSDSNSIDLIRARWRSPAVHATMRSSYMPEGEEGLIWVVESEMTPTNADAYSPTTTNFGYLGSVREKGTADPTGYNFSLWAFDADATEGELPDQKNMPHMLNVSSPEAKYAFFTGEGVGVKFKNYDPYENESGNKQIIGYAISAGGATSSAIGSSRYDEFFTYYFSNRENKFKLMGSANDIHDPNFKRDQVGTFLEVPGAADKERTGIIPMDISYKGWVLATDNNWYPIDTFKATGNKGSEEEPINSNWRLDTSKKVFVLEMTGFKQNVFTDSNEFHLDKTSPLPDYLRGKTFDDLTSYPTIPLTVSLEKTLVTKSGSDAQIQFTLQGVDDATEVKVYYGNEDRLTYTSDLSGSTSETDYYYPAWEHSQELESPQEGLNEYTLSGLDPEGQYYFRIYAKNAEAQAWTNVTGKIVNASIGPKVELDESYTVDSNQEITITALVSDNTGTPVSYDWDVPEQMTILSQFDESVILQAPETETDQSLPISLTVVDDRDMSTTEESVIEVVGVSNIPEWDGSESYQNCTRVMYDSGNGSGSLTYVNLWTLSPGSPEPNFNLAEESIVNGYLGQDQVWVFDNDPLMLQYGCE